MSLSAIDIDAGPQPARKRMLWVLLGAVAVAQLFAFWLLCSRSFRKVPRCICAYDS